MNDRVTVLHLDTERGWRGGERQALWLAEALAGGGHRSIVAARRNEPLLAAALKCNVPAYEFSPRSEVDLFAIARLRRFIGREQVQIVHAHTGHAVAIGALATMGTSARMVMTRRVDFRLRNNPFSRWIYGRAAAIIAISAAVADALEASGVERSRIQIVHSGMNLDRAIAPASSTRLEELGARSRPLIVQVAAFVPHKDPVTFVRAMSVVREALPSAQALMLGEGPLRGEVERVRRELGLEEVVHVPGHIGDAESVLAAADVATLSSREEGLGTVLLEALALGIPVAACAGGGIPESIVNDRTGLTVPPGDHSALGGAIVRLIEDPSLAMRLCAAGRARVRESFSIERTAAATLAVYRRVLAEAK